MRKIEIWMYSRKTVELEITVKLTKPELERVMVCLKCKVYLNVQNELYFISIYCLSVCLCVKH